MFNAEIYTERRSRLKKMVSGGILLLTSNNESPMNYPANTYHYRQDSSFLYFFGIDLPGLTGLIDLDTGQDFIFGDNIDIDDIIWMGQQPTVMQLAAKAGVTETGPVSKLFEVVHKAISQGRKIHYLPPYRADNRLFLENLLNIPHSEQKAHASVDFIKAVVALRSVKDKFEIAEIEKACETGYKMHYTAMKMAKPGIYEREIAGHIEGISLADGGSVSFPVILSINGEILHNHNHSNMLADGKLMICDAGAETSMHYASDFTRTFPVNGKFSPKQKDIYEIVLQANDAAREATRPGVTYKSVHMLACKTIASGLKSLGLMKGNIDEAVNAGAHCLFLPHGLGHMMGLDVHDMEDLGENYVGYDDEVKRSDQFGTAYLRLGKKLQPGYVITDEPGIYFIPALIDIWKKENKFPDFINYSRVEEYLDFGGIRIEDDILVTDNGCRLLGKRLPATVAEIEEVMRK